jgi:hypothetical protein
VNLAFAKDAFNLNCDTDPAGQGYVTCCLFPPYFIIDFPLSLIADTLLLPLTIPKQIIHGSIGAPKPPDSISVGMPTQQAESALKTAGATEVQMVMIGETKSDIIKSYDLTDGCVLIVTVSKSNNKISKMSVCRDADLPKSKRTWTAVQSVALTKD